MAHAEARDEKSPSGGGENPRHHQNKHSKPSIDGGRDHVLRPHMETWKMLIFSRNLKTFGVIYGDVRGIKGDVGEIKK